jgi:hypothetical protein
MPYNIALFKPNLNFLDEYLYKSPVWGFTGIRVVGAEWTPADGQTDVTKLMGAFRGLREFA